MSWKTPEEKDPPCNVRILIVYGPTAHDMGIGTTSLARDAEGKMIALVEGKIVRILAWSDLQDVAFALATMSQLEEEEPDPSLIRAQHGE